MVANLRSMFGMRLISVEGIILKYLPKKVAHSMKINSVDVSLRTLWICMVNLVVSRVAL